MIELHLQHQTSLSRAAAFAKIAEHERFMRSAILRTRIVQPGAPEPRGAGLLREARVRFVGMVLHERILEFSPPYRLAYQIESMRCFGIPIRIKHELGWLTLSSVGNKTQIDWHTRFLLVNRPVSALFAGLLKPILRRLLNAAFPS
jgi:Polyketide cyclase / dehydrase and lipid transport